MSIKFFRKRQKLVVIVMIVCMFSFLVSFQGINYFFQTRNSRITVATANFGDITQQDVDDGDIAFGVIRGIGAALPKDQMYVLQMIARNETQEKIGLVYITLLEEAVEKGIDVSSAEVDRAITQYSQGKFDFNRYVDVLKMQNISGRTVRQILEGWLKIVKSFQSSVKIYPPSKAELEKLYVDINEKMALKVVTLDAKDYTAKLPEPAKEQIQKQFEEYKGNMAGEFMGVNKPRFGYVIPAKADISWLMVSYNAIISTGQVTPQELKEFYEKNKESFVAKEEKGKKTYKPFNEVKREAFDAVMMENAGRKLETIIANVQADIRKNMATGVEDAKMADVYKAAEKDLLTPAKDVLARQMPIVIVENEPLYLAIQKIGSMAQPKLDVIAMPFGSKGAISVDPFKKVSLTAQGVTVGEALAKLFKDNKITEMQNVSWKSWLAMDNAIFPSNMLPMQVGQTGLKTGKQLLKQPVVGRGFSWKKRAGLVTTAMSVKELEPGKDILKVNQPGPEMVCTERENPGMIFWAVNAVEQKKIPAEMTPEIQKQVVEDIKISEGLKLAADAAATIQTPADLDAFVKAGKGKEITTKLFSRMVMRIDPYGSQYHYFENVKLPAMMFVNEKVDEYFISEAFATLAPENLEPGKYTKASAKLMHLTLPCQEYVLVAQRVDYAPALAENFEAAAGKYAPTLKGNQMAEMYITWFDYKNIAKRCELKLTASGEAEEQSE